MRSASMLVGVLVVLAACPAPNVPAVAIPPVSTGKVRVRVFAEPSPVRMLAVTERFVFVATETDVERFDASGGVFAMSSNAGLAGRQIVALGPDPEQRAVWIATNGGLGRYDAATETFRAMPMPAPSLGLSFDEIDNQSASVAAAIDGGAWLGTEQGLFYVHPDAGWSATPIKDSVRALLRDRAGWLWIATPAGLRVRKPSGEVMTIGLLNGCSIAEPRLLIELPDDRMLAIGADREGHELMAFGTKLTWASYRALPEVHW
ncbi:MAG: two-component regulator propeller domain-containing protein, partial [Kofleriaceae bacterium]